MNILFIHQFFTTDDEPGEVRHIAMFRYLLEQGYTFTIIGGALNYMTGKPFDDFHGIFQEKDLVPGKIKLIRVSIPETYRKGFLGKILCYISFLFLSVIASLKIGKYDLLLTTSPSLLTALAGYIISKIKAIPFLLEVRDLWPKVAMEMGMVKNKFIIYTASFLELFLYNKAKRIIVITQGYADYIKSKGIEASKIDVIYNGVDTCMLDYERSKKIPEELSNVIDKFIVMHIGAIGKFNYIDDLLHSIELIKEPEKFAFVFIGDGAEKKKLMAYAKEKLLDNVFFLGSKQKKEIPEYLSFADLTIAIYPQIPTGKLLLQNKVLDCLAMGKAIILVAPEGDTSQIIENSKCGFRVDKNPEIIAEKIMWALNNKEICGEMGIRGREYVRKHLNRENLAYHLGNIFKVGIL